ERPRRLALVPAMLAERMLDDAALVRVDLGAQVLDRIEVEPALPGGRCRGGRAGLRLARGGRERFPRRIERIELDVSDRLVPAIPAIDRALDHIAQLAHVARPGVLLELARDVLCEAGPAF